MTTELKTVTLNFNVNNPTQNGRKYDTMNLLEQLADMAFQRKLLISTNMDIPLDVQSVIGVVHRVAPWNGKVTFHYKPTGNRLEQIVNIYKSVTTCGTGSLKKRDDGITEVVDFKLSHLSLNMEEYYEHPSVQRP